jgi:DNA-binding response OmpR family regulator
MVFLVDDDSDDLEIMCEALYENSYKGPVETLSNGRELMNKLSNGKALPHVIVLDLNMPFKDGFQTLNEIRNNPSFSQIPVVVLTASTRKEDEIRSLESGCNYFFTKPFKMEHYEMVVKVIKTFVTG